MKPSVEPSREGTTSARTASGVARSSASTNSPRHGWPSPDKDSNTCRAAAGSVNRPATASRPVICSRAQPVRRRKASLANSARCRPSTTTTASLELPTVARTCESWCSAISRRTALTCTMMSISEAPIARASASSLPVHGSAVPRTSSDQAAKELRGDSSIGLVATTALAGLPAQVTVISCSLRNHIR